MLLFGCGAVFASVVGHTVPSVHFTGMAPPGTYSSPLILGLSSPTVAIFCFSSQQELRALQCLHLIRQFFTQLMQSFLFPTSQCCGKRDAPVASHALGRSSGSG
jgi:hypothetical protein